MDSRVSTLALHQGSVADINLTQANLAKTQRQISSGKIADTFADLSNHGQVERILNLEDRLQKVSDYITNNTTVSGRISATDTAVEKILQTVSQLRDTLTIKRSSAGAALPLTQLARAAISNVTDSLNLKYEGRYIFAGSKTDTLPVAGIDTESNLINGEPSANYYAGDNVVIKVRANDSLELSYGVRANEDGFQQAFAAMYKAIEADETGSDDKLAEAIDLATSSISELTQIRARLNNNNVIIQNVNDSHQSLKGYFNQVVSNITSTDLPNASIRASMDQTTLQAIFQTFARISSLTLSKYLS